MSKRKLDNSKYSFTIVNTTNFDIGQRVQVVFNNMYSICLGMIPANSSQEIPTGIESIQELKIYDNGFLWSNGGDTITNVVGGDTYKIVVDQSNPPLTEEESHIISKEVVDCLENGVEYEELWDAVKERQPKIYGNRTGDIDKVIKCEFRPWTKWYNPPKVVDQKTILPEDQPYRVEAYWRALDRSPGGNLDVHNLCIKFRSNGKIYGIRYYIYDGSHSVDIYIPPELSMKDFLGEIKDIFEEYKGPKDTEFTYLDLNSQDTDEDDTEWSSIEILVLSPPQWSTTTHKLLRESKRKEITTFLLVNQRLGNPLSRDELQHLFGFVVTGEPWNTRFRLHRKVIYGSQWYRPQNEEESNHIEPTPEQQKVIQQFNELVGVGRVIEFAEGADEPCQAAVELSDAEVRINEPCYISLPYIPPLYYRGERYGYQKLK